MLKELSVNTPLMETLEQMLGYTKLMKDLVTKKGIVMVEPIDNLHHYSVITTGSLARRRKIQELSLSHALLGPMILHGLSVIWVLALT